MKQYIAVEQLNGLSDSGKEKLREWWKFNQSMADWYFDGEFVRAVLDDVGKVRAVVEGYPLLSIGQMIEFLVGVYGKRVDLDQYKDWNNPDADWRVEAKHMTYMDKELCDALWQATKEILEEK